MGSDATGFTGNIPQHYDQGLGPIIFAEYAADIARRAAAGSPARVLETAAGTGIVTRKLRDALPDGAQLTATDFNPPMLDIARTKFWPGEQAAFYLSSYFVRGGKKTSLTTNVLAGDLPRLVVFIGRDLTKRTGCTMRNLRRSRRLWVCLREQEPFPAQWSLEDLAELDRFCPFSSSPARAP